MSFPSMRYDILILNKTTAETNSIEDLLRVNTYKYLSPLNKRTVIDLSNYNGMDKNFGYHTSDSYTCRDIVISTIGSYLKGYDPIVRYCTDGSMRNNPLLSIKIGITIFKPNVPEYVFGYAKKYAHMDFNELLIKKTQDDNIRIEFSSELFSAPKLSMLLFIINRSEFWTEETLKNVDLLIKDILSHPRVMFPNNLDGAVALAIYQCFVMKHQNKTIDYIDNYNKNYYDGIATLGMDYALNNPLDFAKYIIDFDIPIESIESNQRIKFKTIDGLYYSWATIKDLARIFYKLEPKKVDEKPKPAPASWDDEDEDEDYDDDYDDDDYDEDEN